MVHEPSTALCMYVRRLSRFEAAYSPKCVEEDFSEVELLLYGALKSSLPQVTFKQHQR